MLTIPATPELEQRLEIRAAERGLKASEYALRLLADSLAQDDSELDALLDKAMGAFSHVGFSSEDLHRERREEVEREERQFEEHFGKEKP